MLELSLRFTSENETAPIFVSLFRPDTGVSTNPVSFTPPLDDKQLADLRWYLEEFSFWPAGPDYERAERIENDFENWGKALRQSVIKGEDAIKLWQQFLDQPTIEFCISNGAAATSKVSRMRKCKTRANPGIAEGGV